MMRLTGKTIIALNRKLDDMEDLLFPSGHTCEEHLAYADRGHGICSNINNSKSFGFHNEQIVLDAPSSRWLGTPEPAMHANEEKFEFLPRLEEAMEQLRERQKETKV